MKTQHFKLGAPLRAALPRPRSHRMIRCNKRKCCKNKLAFHRLLSFMVLLLENGPPRKEISSIIFSMISPNALGIKIEPEQMMRATLPCKIIFPIFGTHLMYSGLLSAWSIQTWCGPIHNMYSITQAELMVKKTARTWLSQKRVLYYSLTLVFFDPTILWFYYSLTLASCSTILWLCNPVRISEVSKLNFPW